MAIDRTGARRRVRAITGWAAAGAAALTAGFAFGASRSAHVAQSASPTPVMPQASDVLPQDNGGSFNPPSASTQPPAGMSGGS